MLCGTLKFHCSNVKHCSFIQLGVFEAERRWASAMSDKMEMEDNPDKLRKRQSVRMHLKRAVYHATTLEALVRNNSRVRVSNFSRAHTSICEGLP